MGHGDTPGENAGEIEMQVDEIQQGPAQDGYTPLTMRTSRGEIACRYYALPEAKRAAIWVGGIGGGFDSPADDLYPRLCRALTAEGITSLRVRYRQPTNLEECLLDALAGLGYLEHEGIEALALVGHSLGGAVAIQAGTASESVRAVVTLATQTAGAQMVGELPPDCGILLLHGTADTTLPARCSEDIFGLAHEPRKLVLYDGAGLGLDAVAAEVEREVRAWLVERLA